MSSKPRLSGLDTGDLLQGRFSTPPAPAVKLPQTAWQRWEMASFAHTSPVQAALTAPASEPEAPLVELPVQIDEAALAKLRLEAQVAGAAEGREQGHAQGHSQGLAEGRAAGLAAVQAQAAQLQALARTLPAALQLAQGSVADDLLALALDIARQVLGQALAAQPQAILAVVHELLQAEPSLCGAPLLLLHPDDAALVRELLADDLQASGWRVRHDAQIERGGCRVTAHNGERDATVQARWERVSAALARPKNAGNLPVSEGVNAA